MEFQNGKNNVYKGSESLRDYYDPNVAPMLPLVEIPSCLNPYHADGVRIYAKMMTMLPAHNVKQLPALNMLDAVPSDKVKTVVEYSSGSTIISMGVLARILHGVDDVQAYLSNKTSSTKLQLMRFFGLDITLFAGPSQPEPCDPRGGIQVARDKARAAASLDGSLGSTVNPNQYENDRNWGAHYKWTGPQILKQLPEINVICVGMGTSGTMTGNGMFFKEHKPSVTRVAVCTAAGQRVPGPRSKALMTPVEFPWKDAVDVVEEVGEQDSYRLSMDLSRRGLICGPSSGFNLQGLYQFLDKKKADGGLQQMKDEHGELHCVFVCCDLPYQYMGEYFTKLGPEEFPQIHNERLTKVDTFRYVEEWEVEVEKALEQIHSHEQSEQSASARVVLDLRRPDDFAASHLREARSVPLRTLKSDSPSPFRDAREMEAQWTELNRIFSDGGHTVAALQGHPVYLVCYGGDTSRVASSILRARGIEAYSLSGGWEALHQQRPSPLVRTGAGSRRAERGAARMLEVDTRRADIGDVMLPVSPMIASMAG